MMYQWNSESRKKVLGRIAQHLYDRGARDIDSFASRLIAEIASFVEAEGRLPGNIEIQTIVGRLRTLLFTANRQITKKDLASWIAKTLANEGKIAIQLLKPSEAVSACKAVRINIDEIHSFREVRKVSPHDVDKLVPLAIPESSIKQSFAQILGEPFVPKDWGGETADLFTSYVVYQNKRLMTGFLLKGPAVKGTLTIRKLGKNGDQVVRLTSNSLDLYVVQFVGPIAQTVVNHLDAHVYQAAQTAKRDRYYCIMDGTDTARLLKAYRKLA
jgi:hypothetical protein